MKSKKISKQNNSMKTKETKILSEKKKSKSTLIDSKKVVGKRKSSPNKSINDSNDNKYNNYNNNTKMTKIQSKQSPKRSTRQNNTNATNNIVNNTKTQSSSSSSSPSIKKRSKRKRKSTEKAKEYLLERKEAEIEKNKKQELKSHEKNKDTNKKMKRSIKKENGDSHQHSKKKLKTENGTPKCISVSKTQTDNDDSSRSSSSSLDDKDIICCICQCGVDFSERGVFSFDDLNDDDQSKSDKDSDYDSSSESDVENDRNDDEQEKSNSDDDSKDENESSLDDDDESSVPYCGVKLPKELYDPNNALLICDGPGCNRSYHQRCHFVPVFCLPRGNWYCLICQFKQKLLMKNGIKKKGMKENLKKLNSPTNVDDETNEEICSLSKPLTAEELDTLFPIPRLDNQSLDDNIHSQLKEDSEISIQDRFEFQSGPLKASILNTEVKRRIKAVIDGALGSIRLEEHTVRGYTETARAKKSLLANFETTKRLPQQLVQGVDRMAHNKMRLRSLMLSMDSAIRNKNDRKMIEDWFFKKKHESTINQDGLNNDIDKMDWDLLQSKLFCGKVRRNEPRFDIADYDGDIEDEGETDDEDPTEKIKCSVCFSGQVQPDNDVVMCDGERCFRAFHMKCCDPIVTQKMLDEDEGGTWFCPYCCALANSMHYTQLEYFGDEMDDDMSDNDSTRSWDEAQDVFTEASVELSSARLWKRGKRDETSDKYLSSLLGLNISLTNDDSSQSESDDESDCSFSISDEEGDPSLSESSSDSSLSGYQSVSWEVDKDEIDALTSSSCEGEISDKNDGERRLRSRPQNGKKDIGKIDRDNILRGKRNRSKVDYQR